MPNHRQLAAGDVAVLLGRNSVIGYTTIEWIESRQGTKERLRCPECRTTALRRTKRPVYRCDNAHEFDQPLRETVPRTLYAAHFSSFMPPDEQIDSRTLARACAEYNGQLVMQILDPARLEETTAGTTRGMLSGLLREEAAYIGPFEAQLSCYEPSTKESRELVMRQIRERRGQATFRRALFERYGNRCMVTGCELVDLVEAAHISPYRTVRDQHPENGLLLRADIHTLFDLDLLGVEPDTLSVRFHPPAVSTGYMEFHGRMLMTLGQPPSRPALESRWAAFQRRRPPRPPRQADRKSLRRVMGGRASTSRCLASTS